VTATRLKIYNDALGHLGARALASLTESRESRRLLDGYWNNGFVDYILEQGFWKWSIRTQEITYDPDMETGFGYRYVFPLPEDFIRIYSICSDEDFVNPITRYAIEAGYIYCDYDTIYFQYVSDDDDYGYNYENWSETFNLYASYHLAWLGCIRITQSESKKIELKKERDKALVDARSKDAMNNPAKFQPLGTWGSARLMGRFGFHAVLPST
jgi:hypothetical protein